MVRRDPSYLHNSMNYSHLVIGRQISCYCGPKDGGKYDLTNACSVCGTGARRVEPIRLPAAKLKDGVSVTLKFEVVIPLRLVSALRALAPNCLREIHDAKSGDPLPFFELIGERVLPRFDAATTGFAKERPCSACQRDGFFNRAHVPLQLVYPGPMPAFSVAETYERFGNSRLMPNFSESLFAVPYLVVSEAVADVLRGERGVEFVPVGSKSS